MKIWLEAYQFPISSVLNTFLNLSISARQTIQDVGFVLQKIFVAAPLQHTLRKKFLFLSAFCFFRDFLFLFFGFLRQLPQNLQGLSHLTLS